MRRGKHGRHERIQCKHLKKLATKTTDLQWCACQQCGPVSVDFLFDIFAEEQQQLDAHPIQA